MVFYYLILEEEERKKKKKGKLLYTHVYFLFPFK